MKTNEWNIDTTHSGIHFSVRHMVVSKVRGRFASYGGTVRIDDEDLARSTVDVSIDAASIDTGVADRDTHLKSADFFDAEKFPELRFQSTKIEKLGDSAYKLSGALTIRDVTRDVTLLVDYGGRAKDPWGNERAGFTARGTLDRKDFGLHWNQVLEAGGVLVGDKIEIDIELELVRKANAERAA
jgi:polyisoprenoid-binding protein YceI